MRLLLLNHYAGSPRHGMEFRPYYLAREWVRRGHTVRIVAAAHSHVRAFNPEVGRDGLVEVIDGIEYQWLPTPTYAGNGLGRALNIASFLWQVWRHRHSWTGRWHPDVVVASSTYPMDFWLARTIARRCHAKLVFELHDLWPTSLIELSGMSAAHPFARLCAWAEASACRQTDLLVSMLPCVQDHVQSLGLPLSRLAIVPNGVSIDDWDADFATLRDDVAQLISSARSRGRAVLGYAGSMGRPNALDTLLHALAQMRVQAPTLIMVGDGHERESLLRQAAEAGLKEVYWRPPIPKAQIPAFLTAIDLAYIGWRNSPLYRYGIAPNKLMDYMMAGCPVLHSVDAGNDPVAEAGAGLTVASESPEAVAQGLLKLLSMSAAERQRMGDAGRRWVRQHHAYDALAERFLVACAAATPRDPPTTIAR